MIEQVIAMILIYLISLFMSDVFAQFISQPVPRIAIEDNYIVFYDMLPSCKNLKMANPTYKLPIDWAKKQSGMPGFIHWNNKEIQFIKTVGQDISDFDKHGITNLVRHEAEKSKDAHLKTSPYDSKKNTPHYIGLHKLIVDAFEIFAVNYPEIAQKLDNKHHCLSVWHMLPIKDCNVYYKIVA